MWSDTEEKKRDEMHIKQMNIKRKHTKRLERRNTSYK